MLSCKNCKNRYVGCHSVCEEYIEFCRNQQELYKKRKMDLEVKAYYDSAMLKAKKSKHSRSDTKIFHKNS